MISVVIPCYNSERFIRPAVESILNQTFRAFELILVDDGSTDSTPEIIQSYADRDSRVRLLKTGNSNTGSGGAARNRAIAEAKYDWIAMLDHDDVALPDRLEKQMAAAEANPHVVVWGSYIHHINAQGDFLSFQAWGATTEAEFYKLRSQGKPTTVYHPTALMRKDILLKVGGYRAEFRGADDLDLFDRMAEYGPILAIPEPLVLYRVHPDSLSMKKYFRQAALTRYILLKGEARAAGRSFPDWETYSAQKQFPLLMLWHYMKTTSRYFYRNAGLAYGERRYLWTLLYVIPAIILYPWHILPRIWQQVLSLSTNRLIKQSQKKSEEAFHA
ncbi:glycosyltransferase family 2 protein [Phormidium tenue FACHB-886]|nr:glycosyltransferase family 2 protein [Phormidium tenue FACHB-886]